MVHKHPGSGRARSDASAGPERVRLRRPPAEFIVTVAPLCLEKMGTPLRLPNRKHSGTYANVGYPLRPKKMDSPYCWKTEIGASLRLQRRVPLPTALSLGSCLGFGGDETPMIRATVASFGVLRIVVLGLFLPSRIITPPKRHFTLPPKE